MKKKLSIRISPLFALPCLLLWFCCDGIWAAAYILSIIVHEFSHVYVAKLLGMDTARVCFNVYGCKAEIEGFDQCDMGRELPIALAGPLFNLMTAVILAVLSQVLYHWYYPLMNMSICNLLLGGFNLLPLLPMDGGRVLRSIVCTFMPRAKGTKLCVDLSVFFGIIMIAAFGYYAFYGKYKIFLALLGIFIILGALSELKKVSRYRLGVMINDGKLSRPKRVRRYAISCEEDLRTAVSYFKDDCFNVVDVVTKDGTIQKTMTEIELMKELLE